MDNLSASATTAGVYTWLTPSVEVFVLYGTAVLVFLALCKWAWSVYKWFAGGRYG